MPNKVEETEAFALALAKLQSAVGPDEHLAFYGLKSQADSGWDCRTAGPSQKLVVVAGGAGFIGYHLCKQLIRQGCSVVIVDNLVTGSGANVAALLEFADDQGQPRPIHLDADIADALQLKSQLTVALSGRRIAAIFDLACPPSPVDFTRMPLEIMATCSTGVRNLLELAREEDALFLHASTSEVYGDPLVSPQDERYFGNVNALGRRGPYDEGKRFAETLILAYAKQLGLRTRICRIFNTYGPRMRPDDGRVLPEFINNGLSSKPLLVTPPGTQTRSFCYVDDLVQGMLLLAASSYPGPVNLGNPDERTIKSVAREVAAELDKRRFPTEIDDNARDPGDPQVRVPRIDLARTLLGWDPVVTFSPGLAATVDWFVKLKNDATAARTAANDAPFLLQ